MAKKLGPVEQLRTYYEAGPTGQVVYWQLARLGGKCEVIAPMLAPVKASARIKADRRDSERLARLLPVPRSDGGGAQTRVPRRGAI